jgi:adenine-specific DNA-methyltransferase
VAEPVRSAKLILASTNRNDFVLDPFLGSGTTCVVANKLDRAYFGIDVDLEYCLLAAKRLELAGVERRIQGLTETGFFGTGILPLRNSISTDVITSSALLLPWCETTVS